MSREHIYTLSPGVSSLRVKEKLEKLYLVGTLDGLLRFQSNWGSDDDDDEYDPFPLPQ